MMCGPVLIQWLVVVGFAAYGSVLLASVPPASIYINPTFPAGGVLWFRYASIQSPAFLSQHIGSGPGVSGLSGMHVKPFVPLRRVRIPPFGSGATTVAFSATFLGAAFMALAINSSSVGADLAPSPVASWCIAGMPSAGGSAAHANPLKLTSTAPAQNTWMDLFIDVSSLEWLYLDVVSNLPPAIDLSHIRFSVTSVKGIWARLCDERTSTPFGHLEAVRNREADSRHKPGGRRASRPASNVTVDAYRRPPSLIDRLSITGLSP